MNSYDKLVQLAEKHDAVVPVVSADGLIEGVAFPCRPSVSRMVKVFYGASDGTDDKILTADEFNNGWVVE